MLKSIQGVGTILVLVRVLSLVSFMSLMSLISIAVAAQDIEGVVEHPMIKRYPGQLIAWQHIENYQPYKVAVGPITGFRTIGDWIETEGRVTRTFYKYEG